MISVSIKWLALLTWILCLVCPVFAHADNKPPAVVDGVIDLRDWDFENNGLVSLNGQWEFYWEQLLEPNEFGLMEPPVPTGFVKVPSKWRLSEESHEPLPSVGYGTYRLKILLPEKRQRLVFRLEPVNSAYRFFVNDELLETGGKVGKTKKDALPDYKIRRVEYFSDSTVLELVIQVSNFRHRNGGILYPIQLGTQKSILALREFRHNVVLFSSGALIIMGIFHLFIYFTRKKDISPFYFGLLCFDMAIRLLGQSTYLWEVFPSTSWDLRLNTDYLTFFLGLLLLALFIHSLFRETFSSKILRGLLIVCSPLALAALVLPASVVTQTIPLAQLVTLFFMVYLLYVLVRSVIQKLEGARIFLFGGVVLFAAAVNDMLYFTGMINTVPVTTLGLVCFMVSQAFLLSLKSSNAFSKNEKLTASYERFVPQEFLKQLGKKEIIDVQLGDCVEVKQMSILFSDIRSFTTLSESMSPEENFQFLNTYLRKMEPSITQNNGVVDKFIGDAIMALFPKSTDDAVKAAISMNQALTEFNVERTRENLVPIKIGVGINTGPMMLGTVGADNRMEGTVISDAVNLAARLEGMTKHYGTSILISENTLENLSNDKGYLIRVADKVIVKGKTEPVTVWEVFDGDPSDIREAKESTLIEFTQGIKHYYDKEFENAIDCFEACLAICPHDKIANTFLARSKKYQKFGIGDDWDGVERLETK